MSDRPIIFSAPMVRALLEGRKIQTRRLATSPLRRCEPGDRLWVRENWSHTGVGVWTIADARRQLDGSPIYQASHDGPAPERWWPSIHMPREFSRLTLHVEAVRVEPLQAISEADAIAEGAAKLVHDGEGHFFESDKGTHRCGFAGLWSHLHGAASWDANPAVVVLTFRVGRSNIDRVLA